MKTNIDKWNYFWGLIDERTNKFIESEIKDKTIPEVYYTIYPSGTISERKLGKISYSHYKHGMSNFFIGKTPTNEHIKKVKLYSESNIPFTTDNLYFEYQEINSKFNAKSSVNYNDIINEVNIFFDLDKAKEKSNEIIEKVKADNEFDELHKKDASYNYSANGYKFLGWQNGWKHEYYDEDGVLCSISNKPSRSIGYTKENYPEYCNCKEQNHRKIEVRHYRNGSENTVSCPICKIYWKYDCSG